MSSAVALADGQRRVFTFDRRYNIRLHLTAPRELYYMQATANRLVVPKNRPLGIATIDYTAGQPGGDTEHVGSAVCRGLSGRAAPQVSRNR